MSVSEKKYTPVDMVHYERMRQGLVRGKTFMSLYHDRYDYLENSYDPYTSYIDNYQDEKRAEEKNARIREEQAQMTEMAGDLTMQENSRYLAMYPKVYHCSSDRAQKMLEKMGHGNQALDELMFRNYNMYKVLSGDAANKDFLKQIGCDVYDQLDRENGMFDTKHFGILPSSKLYHENESRQKIVLDRYDVQVRDLASRYGYNGYRAYLMDHFREVSDIMNSEGRTVPTQDEIKDLTVDAYGNIYYGEDEAKFLKEYDARLFDSAMTDDTKQRLAGTKRMLLDPGLYTEDTADNYFNNEDSGFSLE